MDFSSSNSSVLLFNSSVVDGDHDYIFSPSSDFCEIAPPLIEENMKNVAMWNEESSFPVPVPVPAVGNGFYSSSTRDVMWPETDNVLSSCFEMSSFSDHQKLGLMPTGRDITEPTPTPTPLFTGYGQRHIGLYNASMESSYQFSMKPESIFEENYEGLFAASSEIQTVYDGSNVWQPIQDNCLLESNIEEPTVKIRRYTEEERKDRIHKYLKKRNQRNFNKTIKYACRKTLADRRIRVRGRFARNSNERIREEEEEHSEKAKNTSNNNNNNPHLQEEEQFSYDHHGSKVAQGKHDENGRDDEGWLEDAISSLMYLPIFANS